LLGNSTCLYPFFGAASYVIHIRDPFIVFPSVAMETLMTNNSQLPKNIHALVVPHCSGTPEIQYTGLSAKARTVRHLFFPLVSFVNANLQPSTNRFQKAIKKVRAVQRMRRNRGFAFSQTETAGKQDQAKLIRAYDTSKSNAKPSGY
jgi:hypothetical protein